MGKDGLARRLPLTQLLHPTGPTERNHLGLRKAKKIQPDTSHHGNELLSNTYPISRTSNNTSCSHHPEQNAQRGGHFYSPWEWTAVTLPDSLCLPNGKGKEKGKGSWERPSEGSHRSWGYINLGGGWYTGRDRTASRQGGMESSS